MNKHRFSKEQLRIWGVRLDQISNPNSYIYDKEFSEKLIKIRPDWFKSKRQIIKEELIKMAKSGAKRPRCNVPDKKESRYGYVLSSSTSSDPDHYDPLFSKTIRDLRPDWFVSRSDIANILKEEFLKIIKQGRIKVLEEHPKRKRYLAYINPKNGVYDEEFVEEIRRINPIFLEKKLNPECTKLELLQMAQKKEPRPPRITHYGGCFSNYIDPKGSGYDSDFINKIKKANPSWLITVKDKFLSKKQELFKLAKAGGPRPKKGHKLHSSLCTCLKYEDSSEQLRKIRPDWFPSDLLQMKKQKILEMIRSGERKPKKGTNLESVFMLYTDPQYKGYDPAFARDVKKLTSKWMSEKEFQCKQNKDKLLKIAEQGLPKPSQKCSLGKALTRYILTNGSSFDQEFKEKLLKKRPDWFADKTEPAKNELLELAKSGKRRPSTISKDQHEKSLANKFLRYRNEKHECYDHDFTDKIKRIRPDWFVAKSEKCNLTKEKLLEMIKNGEPKPRQNSKDETERHLASSFSSYTNKNSGSYDPEFTAIVKKIGPSWIKMRRARQCL